MPAMTYKFNFSAKNKTEIHDIIQEKIANFIDIGEDFPKPYINYETYVVDNDKDKNYQVEVVARIRDDN